MMHLGVLAVGITLAVMMPAPADLAGLAPPRPDGPGKNASLELIPPLPTLPPIPTLPPAPTIPPLPTLTTLPPVPTPPTVPILPPIPPPPALPTPPPIATPTQSPTADGSSMRPLPSPGGFGLPAPSRTDRPGQPGTSPTPSPSSGGPVGSDRASQPEAIAASPTAGAVAPVRNPEGFEGIVLPVLGIGVPVLLGLAVLLAQLIGGVALLPAIRHTLGGLGLRRAADGSAAAVAERAQPVKPESPA